MKEESNAKKPEFYKSFANNPRIDQLDGGSQVGFTNLPIVGNVKSEITFSFGGFGGPIFTFEHNLGKRYEAFARVRKKGVLGWTSLPHVIVNFDGPPSEISIQDIRANEIDIMFSTSNTGTYEVEIYFIDFAL